MTNQINNVRSVPVPEIPLPIRRDDPSKNPYARGSAFDDPNVEVTQSQVEALHGDTVTQEVRTRAELARTLYAPNGAMFRVRTPLWANVKRYMKPTFPAALYQGNSANARFISSRLM